MSRSILLAGGVVVVLVAVSAGTYFYFYKTSAPGVVESISAINKQGIPQPSNDTFGVVQQTTSTSLNGKKENTPLAIKEIHQEYVADFSNDKILVGGSQNVFVAKIIKEVGNKTNISWMPRTQFEVEVISNVKGYLQGRITVSQIGGYLNGVLYVSNEDILGPSDSPSAGHLLQPGSTYLLATRYSSTDGWYAVNSFPNVIALISQDSNLTTNQLTSLAVSNNRVRQLEKAYPNEILLQADILHNNTLNSYQSLTEAQKYALPYYTGFYRPSTPTSTATSTATSTQ